MTNFIVVLVLNLNLSLLISVTSDELWLGKYVVQLTRLYITTTPSHTYPSRTHPSHTYPPHIPITHLSHTYAPHTPITHIQWRSQDFSEGEEAIVMTQL